MEAGSHAALFFWLDGSARHQSPRRISHARLHHLILATPSPRTVRPSTHLARPPAPAQAGSSRGPKPGTSAAA